MFTFTDCDSKTWCVFYPPNYNLILMCCEHLKGEVALGKSSPSPSLSWPSSLLSDSTDCWLGSNYWSVIGRQLMKVYWVPKYYWMTDKWVWWRAVLLLVWNWPIRLAIHWTLTTALLTSCLAVRYWPCPAWSKHQHNWSCLANVSYNIYTHSNLPDSSNTF